jgi:hypothetical protein
VIREAGRAAGGRENVELCRLRTTRASCGLARMPRRFWHACSCGRKPCSGSVGQPGPAATATGVVRPKMGYPSTMQLPFEPTDVQFCSGQAFGDSLEQLAFATVAQLVEGNCG